jgi:hypothetical protein
MWPFVYLMDKTHICHRNSPWNGWHSCVLLHIREVSGSNIDPETSYHEFLVVFLSPTRQMPG